MSEIFDFEFYCEELLIFAAKNCDGSEHSCVGADFFYTQNFPDMPDRWRSDAAITLAARGLGWSRNGGEDQEFFIGPQGLIRAKEIEKKRKPRGLADLLRAVPRSDWVSFSAVIVSIIALFKS
jgi:hypothetical protein